MLIMISNSLHKLFTSKIYLRVYIYLCSSPQFHFDIAQISLYKSVDKDSIVNPRVLRFEVCGSDLTRSFQRIKNLCAK